jgi:phage tail-like protein
VLDRDHARLWELDRRLAVVSSAQSSVALAPAEADLFQPLDGGPPRQRPAAAFPAGIDLRAAAAAGIEPIAVEALGPHRVLILDRNQPARQSRLFCLRRAGDKLTVDGAVELGGLAHDVVLAKPQIRAADASPPQLLVATAAGNQAAGFFIDAGQGSFGLRKAVELFPLRRFGGRALLEVQGAAWYDSGLDALRWTPVVQQPRVRYRDRAAALVTPVFDGAEPQCVWDRVMLDACIPHDARLEVWCRCADERTAMAGPAAAGEFEIIGGWALQPQAYLRGDGAELPWLRAESARRTRRESGVGTWELLLQNMRGRYLQLKLVFSGNGTSTPWLRALRAWFPRFSYPERFLPAVYRENPQDADFIERFLANMEGVNTTIEGRIAQMQALLDPRCAPDEALDWLASWFDVALDPNWEDWRRRLFIRHAMDFFQWRGTVHGLRLALSFAFGQCLDEAAFQAPGPTGARPPAIRIVEAYQARRVGAVAAGDPGGAEAGPRTVRLDTLWTPMEGGAGLVRRYAEFLQRPLAVQEQLAAFDLAPPVDAGLTDLENAQNQARWRQFCEQNLGFAPAAGALERQRWQRFLAARAAAAGDFAAARLPADWPGDAALAALWQDFCALPDPARVRFRWQDFLARRYRRIERLNAACRTAWPAFDWVALPDRLPETAAAQADWLQFEKQLLAMARTAHRFSVLLPVFAVTEDPFEMERRLRLARRIVELEKPAHTVFDVRFYWALNRVGEARLGLDTLLDVGSRAPQLIPDAVLGRAYVGASFVGGPPPPDGGDRQLLAC